MPALIPTMGSSATEGQKHAINHVKVIEQDICGCKISHRQGLQVSPACCRYISVRYTVHQRPLFWTGLTPVGLPSSASCNTSCPFCLRSSMHRYKPHQGQPFQVMSVSARSLLDQAGIEGEVREVGCKSIMRGLCTPACQGPPHCLQKL